MTRIDVSNLSVSYGKTAALRSVSIHAEAGELIGIIGANGAGKTTLLSTIFGFKRADSGAVTLGGESILGLSPERVVRQGISLVPEGRRIFTTLTVGENLAVGATLTPRDERQGRIEAQLDRFPVLRKYFDTPAGRLSGGEQQQLAIARALINEPKVLLLDEPSLGLAPKIVDLVFEVLDELRQLGVTMLLVEQNALRTLAFADRTYVLSTGTVEMESTRGDTSTMPDAKAVADLYLGGKKGQQV